MARGVIPRLPGGILAGGIVDVLNIARILMIGTKVCCIGRCRARG